jgi:1,4-dihydroxy-6-naphthoate synthase
MAKTELVLAHSPDSDDAFMFYGLATQKLRSRTISFTHILADIETLNRGAMEGKYDVTAVSYHAYPYIADRYQLMATGGSMGDGYGPLVVAPRLFAPEELKGKRVAVPGLLTSAYLALKLFQPDVETVVVRFDEIVNSVLAGKVDAGLLIHEGQLIFDRDGLHRIVDLGRWWLQLHQLPLPLGGLVMSRSLAPEVRKEAARLIRQSVEYGLKHREEALAYAMQFARQLEERLADKFVGMYVNDYTVDCGEKGRKAIELLLDRGYEAGVIPKQAPLDFL